MNRWLPILKNFYARKPFLALAIIGFLSRLMVIIGYSGQVSFFGDSDGYIALAQRLSQFDLNGYDGTRTPGFPALLALAGNNLYILTLLQGIFGIITSLLWYDIITKEFNRKRVAFTVAVLLSTLLHVLFYERAILTETLTLFMVSFSLWYLIKYRFFKEGFSWHHAIVCSVLMMITFAVRPMFLILPLFVAVCNLYLHLRKQKLKAFVVSLILLTPTLLAYNYWVQLNKENTGYARMTSFTGITMAQTTLNFVDEAPDEYAELRDIYIRKRDSLTAIDGAVAMSIWQVYGELQRKEGITVAQFSQRLTPMNSYLIKNHPDRYLKQVAIAWWDFWGTGMFWDYDAFKYTIPKKASIGIWLIIQYPLLIVAKLIFVVLAFFIILKRIVLKRWKLDFMLFILLFTLGCSLAQALVVYGSNSRFSFPFLPIILFVICYYGENLWHRRKSLF
ncbi:hypothetical protein EAX61_06545 [Dokdonia sinensis]|uniref:Glycosyltransferase RgtA/B/C/D-like domain-containing protein n=1 Tax=Dokdonia sinensis TaxID=2479847 RepID=A0A3M0GT25_9FLAO|nr:glycosyltransferase family 39 protein [Dokdonia sinensis]RMB60476.1 hypothetical protein EAX61_06545 [Dokdonia sinensis]